MSFWKKRKWEVVDTALTLIANAKKRTLAINYKDSFEPGSPELQAFSNRLYGHFLLRKKELPLRVAVSEGHLVFENEGILLPMSNMEWHLGTCFAQLESTFGDEITGRRAPPAVISAFFGKWLQAFEADPSILPFCEAELVTCDLGKFLVVTRVREYHIGASP